MRLIKQNKPQCLLYAFAMAWDILPDELIQLIGHDGMEVWWPEASGAFRHRGFHHQEFVDLGFLLGWRVIMVEALPNLGWRDKHRVIMDDSELQGRINTYLQIFDGVLVSDKHAVAWCAKEQKCYDPNGYVYGVDEFAIREFFITVRENENETVTERFRRTLQGVRTSNTNEAGRTGSVS